MVEMVDRPSCCKPPRAQLICAEGIMARPHLYVFDEVNWCVWVARLCSTSSTRIASSFRAMPHRFSTSPARTELAMCFSPTSSAMSRTSCPHCRSSSPKVARIPWCSRARVSRSSAASRPSSLQRPPKSRTSSAHSWFFVLMSLVRSFVVSRIISEHLCSTFASEVLSSCCSCLRTSRSNDDPRSTSSWAACRLLKKACRPFNSCTRPARSSAKRCSRSLHLAAKSRESSSCRRWSPSWDDFSSTCALWMLGERSLVASRTSSSHLLSRLLSESRSACSSVCRASRSSVQRSERPLVLACTSCRCSSSRSSAARARSACSRSRRSRSVSLKACSSTSFSSFVIFSHWRR
mmetsp:Transcript_11929/g.32675  ORF Transcript_11929/g.32675 Transcript_11929/m.32675 type:complete len:349 (+) Transcript_11929:209-1255(+)